jgi:hypothetical protein
MEHQKAVQELKERGFDTEWIIEYNSQLTYDNKPEGFDGAKTSEVLDYLEIEGQVKDGLFEDPFNGPPCNFAELFDLPGLIGRMMYFMLRFHGINYEYKHLLGDIELLAEEKYEIPFDREKASLVNDF